MKTVKYEFSPLILAVEQNRSDIVSLFLSYPDTDVDQTDKFESTPLHLACDLGTIEVARILTKHNATIDKQNKYTVTPLWYAIYHGREDLTWFLIDNGAKLSNMWRDPLAYAKIWGLQDKFLYSLLGTTMINHITTK